MLRRFIWSPATRQQSSSSVGTEAFSTTVFTFAPKRAVPQKGTSGRPTRTEQHLEKEIARSTPRLALAREPTQSKQGKGRSAPRVQQEEQYKHWYRHTYGVGDKRDTTWSVTHASFPDAPTAQTGHRRRQPVPQRTATVLPYDSLARSMEIQQCSKVASDILAVVAGEGYAGSSSNTTGFGAEGALDVSPAVDSPRKCKGAKSRRAKAKAKAKARAEARSRDLLSARREHNADHAHWFKHTYCLPDWDVVLVEALLNHSPSSSSLKVHLHHASHAPSKSADNSTTASSTSNNTTNNTINNKNCLCDLSRAARSSVEMSMLVQRLQNLSADPQDMTARTIFNMH